MRRAGLLAIAALVATAGCASIPEPTGATVASAHYEIRTASEDLAAVRSAALVAEVYHQRLESYFGAPVGARCIVVACDDDTFRSTEPREGLVGEFRPSFWGTPHIVLVELSRQPVPRYVLAHEQVHFFVRELRPGLPSWMNEGLAREIAHETLPTDVDVLFTLEELRSTLTRTPDASPEHAKALAAVDGAIARAKELAELVKSADPLVARCCVSETAQLADGEIRAAIAELPDSFGSANEERDGHVAGALIRWAIATHPQWQTLAAIEPFEPDADRFLAWLRSGVDARKLHERFPPITLPGER